MTRSLVLPFALFLLGGCGLEDSSTDDTGAPAANGSNGYSWGSAGDGESDDEETDPATETATPTEDTGTAPVDTGTEPVEPAKAVAKFWIVPETTWDVSVTTRATPNPVFYMYPVANVSSGDWAGYGSTYVATTSTNAYVYDTVEYLPGETLSINGVWSDGVNTRYFAEAGGVVNALEYRIVIEFIEGEEAGRWQGYAITGATPDAAGKAGWVTNSTNDGGNVYVQTYADTDDHHDRSSMK